MTTTTKHIKVHLGAAFTGVAFVAALIVLAGYYIVVQRTEACLTAPVEVENSQADNSISVIPIEKKEFKQMPAKMPVTELGPMPREVTIKVFLLNLLKDHDDWILYPSGFMEAKLELPRTIRTGRIGFGYVDDKGKARLEVQVDLNSITNLFSAEDLAELSLALEKRRSFLTCNKDEIEKEKKRKMVEAFIKGLQP